MRNTQVGMVLEHLGKHKTITSWEAIQQYRITRLAEFIRQLRSEGFDIESHWVESNGKRFVRYYLNSEQTASLAEIGA